MVGVAASALPPDHVPADRPLLLLPRLIELCFQTAGAWELGRAGRLGLPSRIQRVAVAGGIEAGPLEAIATARTGEEGFDVAVVDTEGRALVRVEGYRTVRLPDGPADRLLAPFRAAAGILR